MNRRWSQTALAHADRCLKSAELYMRVPQPPSHAKSRGSAFHLAAERMLRMMIAEDERTLYALGHTQDKHGTAIPEDEASARREVASFTEQIVSEIRAEHPELHCTHDDWDKVRIMAFHWATATPVEAGRVVAVERKFVLDVGPCVVSGKIDVATLAGTSAEVLDYKTSLALPGQEEFEASFQHKLYATLVAFGVPTHNDPCSDCEDGEVRFNPSTRGGRKLDPQQEDSRPCTTCDGKTTIEVREEPLPGPVQWVRCRELYPRYLRDDGSLWERERTLTRTELTDFRVDLEALVGRVFNAQAENEWPAVPGHHCAICPAPHECPLPAELRVPRGVEEGMTLEPVEVTEGNAAELAERWLFLDGYATRIKKALRAHAAGTECPIPIGTDLELAFRADTKRTVDWSAFDEAVAEADRAGRPRPVPRDYQTESKSTPFVKRRVKKERAA